MGQQNREAADRQRSCVKNRHRHERSEKESVEAEGRLGADWSWGGNRD